MMKLIALTLLALASASADVMETADAFLVSCETGKGFGAVSELVAADAPFSAQTDMLAEVTTVAGYVDWMKAFLDGNDVATYTTDGLAYDAKRNTVLFAAVFFPAGEGEGKPSLDYTYTLHFNAEGKIDWMKKAWNDGFSMRLLGMGETAIITAADAFLVACETGKGFGAVSEHVAADAPFSAQTDMLAEVTTVAGFADWMHAFLEGNDVATYTTEHRSYDAERGTVAFHGVFFPAGEGEGKPGLDYTYTLHFNAEGKIDWMKKAWNDAFSMRLLDRHHAKEEL